MAKRRGTPKAVTRARWTFRCRTWASARRSRWGVACVMCASTARWPRRWAAPRRPRNWRWARNGRECSRWIRTCRKSATAIGRACSPAKSRHATPNACGRGAVRRKRCRCRARAVNHCNKSLIAPGLHWCVPALASAARIACWWWRTMRSTGCCCATCWASRSRACGGSDRRRRRSTCLRVPAWMHSKSCA